MGTTWNAVIPQGKEKAAKLKGIIQESLNQVDRAMSTWNPESELSRFNTGPDLIATWISPNTMTVIGEALSVAEISGGAFDPTILPLVELWGFGSTAQREIPDSKAIDAALENIGWQNWNKPCHPFEKKFAVENAKEFITKWALAEHLVLIAI